MAVQIYHHPEFGPTRLGAQEFSAAALATAALRLPEVEELALIFQNNMTAIVLQRALPQSLTAALEQEVASGRGPFFTPKRVRLSELENPLEQHLAQMTQLPERARELLVSDICGLASRFHALAQFAARTGALGCDPITLEAHRRREELYLAFETIPPYREPTAPPHGFHADRLNGGNAYPPIRLLVTYTGVGTQYVDPQDVDDEARILSKSPLRRGYKVQTTPTAAVLLFRGERSLGAGTPLVHRRSPSESERWLLTINFPC